MVHQWRLDVLSIPNYVIKKERPHGNRHGENLKHKKSTSSPIIQERDVSKRGFERIHDRFQKDLKFRDSQLRIDRTEAKCIQMDEVALERFHLSLIVRRAWEIKEDLVYLSQHIWTKCTDETPIRLQRSINKDASSSPRAWRRTTCTDSFLPVSEMAFVVFFIQFIMVAVERSLVELIKFIKVNSIWAHEMSGITEQGDVLKTLLH